MNTPSFVQALLLVTSGAITPGQDPTPSESHLQQQVVAHHAALSKQFYSSARTKAQGLLRSVELLLEHPDEEHLRAARLAWVEGRKVYGKTEVLRFHDGPIEVLEPLINAWPVDEAFIDYIVGRENTGIINQPEQYPSLGATVLELANERGGEANICVGWHAIEFALWGQDLSPTGPGARPASDFEIGVGPSAARRREYLHTVCGLLVKHLGQLEQAWAPERDNYRQKFELEESASVRRILTGATVLSAFELGGERLTVAFDTRDQEQEHSCFSDQTWLDFVANQEGLMQVIHGCEVGGKFGPGILALVESRNPELALALKEGLARTDECLRAIPQPFDQAILGPDGSPERATIEAAIFALEAQTELLLIVGKELGHSLPLNPRD